MLRDFWYSSRFVVAQSCCGCSLGSLLLRGGALSALLVALLTDSAPAAVIVPISSDNLQLRDNTGDDLGDTTTAPASGATAIGEANGIPVGNTTEIRYWMPFSLNASQRDAIANAALVLVETQLDSKTNTSGLSVDTLGISGRTSTIGAVSDYQAAASLLQTNTYEDTTPIGRQSVDITSFAKQEAAVPGSVLVLRTQIAPSGSIPNNNGIVNTFIVTSQDTANVSKRPVLTVVPGGTALINDDFNNGVLATGGTNGGFTLVGNGFGSGSATEFASHATVTANGTSNNSGLVSNNTFNPGSDGFHAVWAVTSADTPAINGLNLTLQANPGFFNTAGQPNLRFRFGGTVGAGVFQLLAHNGASEITLASDTFTSSTLNDGFTVVASILPTGWEYTLVGLDGLTNSTLSGAWGANHNFANLFDSSTHIGAFIQTGGVARNLTLDRMAVFAAVPEPSTFWLSLAGLAMAGVAARRYRPKRLAAAVN